MELNEVVRNILKRIKIKYAVLKIVRTNNNWRKFQIWGKLFKFEDFLSSLKI